MPSTNRARIAGRALAACLFALLPACHTARPDPAPEAAISAAAGLPDAIKFRVEAGPLDESPPAGDGLTLTEAVRRAVTTDPAIQAALARVRIAMADADQARLLPNPVLDFVIRWGPGKPQIEVTLAQELIQVFQSPRRSSAADNRMRQAAADAVTVALDVVAEVQERYATAQARDAIVPVLEERRAILTRLEEVARSRLLAGEGTRSDSAGLEAQGIELDIEIAQAKLARREQRLRLARLIGEPSGDAAWRLDLWSSAAVDLPESAWIEAALRSRPELQSITWQLAALGDDFALTKLAPWEGAGISVDVTRDDSFFAGPGVSTPLPLFDTGRVRRDRVTAQQIEARHNLASAQRIVIEEVRVGYETFAASVASVRRIRTELIPLQEERRRVSEDIFRAENEIIPLLLAEQDLRAAHGRAIEVELQASTALFRLQRAVGGPGIAAGLTGPAPQSPVTETPP